MPIIPTEVLSPLMWLGSAWLLLVASWVAACLWVARDARAVFGRSMPWKLVFASAGVAIVLSTLSFGLTSMALLIDLAVLSCLGLVYFLHRETTLPSDRRVFPRSTIFDRLRAILARTGFEAWLTRITARGRTAAKEPATEIQVVLLKKDGRAFDGNASQGIDRDTSRAVLSVQGILATAIQRRATDVHLEPKSSDKLQIRLRIDGIMQTLAALDGDSGRSVVSAIKVLGDMDIAERRRPQDGTFAMVSGGRRFDIRAASGPTAFGEKVALRLLDSGGGIVKSGLASLGIRKATASSLHTLTRRNDGMLIVSGPTGSGKTTTLYALLSEIDALTRNIVTIEDPIEYQLDNITQTAVHSDAGLTFSAILRSILRQDPDVILVGEIRDKETAEIAMQAALTGHLVFTTLHANDTTTTVTRLLELGIETTLIQSAVTAVVAQRLVRVLCSGCKQPYRPDPTFLQKCGIRPEQNPVFYREQGCAACHGTGYLGRTGIYEMMVCDAAIRELLVGRPSPQTLRSAAKRNGTRSLREDGLTKVLSGVTSVEEIIRVTK